MSIKQKRPNYGIHEFALRAFDYDGNVVGRFDDQQTGTLALRHHTCPNGANVKKFDSNRLILFLSRRLFMWIKLKLVVIVKFH